MCKVTHTEETIQQLMQESRQVPRQCCKECARCAKEPDRLFVLPITYVVLKGTFCVDRGRCRDVAVTQMLGVAVQVVGKLLSKYMQSREDEVERIKRTTEVIQKLEASLFLGRAECVCNPLHSVYKECKRLPSKSRYFIVQQRYLRVYPKGLRHQQSRVTDAVGEADRFRQQQLPQTVYSQRAWNLDKQYDGCKFCLGLANIDTLASLYGQVGRYIELCS